MKRKMVNLNVESKSSAQIESVFFICITIFFLDKFPLHSI